MKPTVAGTVPRHHASASKTDLLLECQWWAGPDVKIPPDPNDPLGTRDPKLLADAPRFGVAFHLAMERHVAGGFAAYGRLRRSAIEKIAVGHRVEPGRLYDYYRRATEFLRGFLADRGWDGIPLVTEKKLAYDPFRDEARFLEGTGSRDYSARRATEIPGQLDMAAVVNEGSLLFTADWKTGSSVYEAKTNKQLDTLSLGLSRVWDARDGRSVNAIFRVDDEFIEPDVAEVGAERWAKHRRHLKQALVRVYSKTPAMRPGAHCKYCPANEICPAIVGPTGMDDVLSDANSSESVRRVYEISRALDKALEKRRQRIMRWVQMNGPIELSNGKELAIVESQRDNLSKASIERALGRVDGQQLIADLRSRGCIEKDTRQELREIVPK
jgi:hypothetical protein